jgi:pimeloyl-ACP methyl ester carboxylesterase
MLTITKNTKPINEQYPDMRTIVYGNNRAYEFKNANSDRLIINIEGSGFYSVLGASTQDTMQKSGWWYFLVEEFGDEFSILVPEKLKFELGKYYYYDVNTRREYTVENLVECYSSVINNYLVENDYSKIILVGSSEGACILPSLYKRLLNKEKIAGMVAISYGGLSWYEQMKILAESPLNVHYLLRDIYKNIDLYKTDIELYPNSIGDFIGNAYTYWNSILEYSPFEEYADIEVPTLFIHGELDTNVPVESTRFVQENLPNKPFEYLYYGDADHHSFRNSIKTINNLRNKSREWIYRQL